jgi:hypothetical protein
MKKNVTLHIDDEVWRQFQIFCIKRRIIPSTVIEQFMVDNIERDHSANNKTQKPTFNSSKRLSIAADEDNVLNHRLNRNTNGMHSKSRKRPFGPFLRR